ncbi:hypothetical protein SAMN04488004_102189 [Loktanella salsilacus]|jgi:hypothetical protein|uniref:Uncharacterized protein n=1 Tax=Loktanella salsilacus TaxID=195913 RepID=A0A1I4CL87_9RHOB|nr:hypothetical protein SAMN04488004_102189 [Loktanella salsilacus]
MRVLRLIEHAAVSGAVTMMKQAAKEPGCLLLLPAFYMVDLRG